MTAAVADEGVRAGARRLVVSPVARPGFQSPQAHPRRPEPVVRRAQVASCVVQRSPRVSPWVAIKLAVVAALAVTGGVVSVAQLAADATPDPSLSYVAGDPAWAHVTQP